MAENGKIWEEAPDRLADECPRWQLAGALAPAREEWRTVSNFVDRQKSPSLCIQE